jgi:hypothetical protein
MKIGVTIFIGLILGAVFLLFNREIILIQLPWASKNCHQMSKVANFVYVQKKVRHFFWRDGRWCSEESMSIWCQNNTAKNIKKIVNSWIFCLQEESLIDHAVWVQSVALSGDNEDVYISFNRSFINSELSIFKKWVLIEGLLKTIREAIAGEEVVQRIKRILFLVNHDHLQDNHLDFSQAWPKDGFWDDNKTLIF